MTRTDIHRPSAPEFDPEAYTLHGVFDTNPDPEFGAHEIQARREAVNALVERGFRFGAGGSTQCGHCGTPIRYAALMVREDAQEFIFVGEICLDGRFELTKVEFDRLRKTATLNRERTAKRDRVAALLAENPGLVWASYGWNVCSEVYDNSWEASTLTDIWSKVERYGDPSPKQVAFVERLVAQVTTRHEERIARRAQDTALAATGVEVPEGRITVEGTILSTKWVDSQYGGSLKMLVKADEGWKVWGTVPSALLPVVAADTLDNLKGSRVRFTGTVERSKDDALFGFFKRPTKAEFVEEVAA